MLGSITRQAALTKDLDSDPRVSEVVDAGPKSSSDKTAYPHFAIAAAELVAQGSPGGLTVLVRSPT